MNRIQKAASFGARMGKQAGVKYARRSGELGPIGSGFLVGGGLGGLAGGLIGAINPGFSEELETEGPANRRKFYKDEQGVKQPYYVDDDGNLLYKRRGALSGALHGGLSGIGWGGLAGGILGGLSGVANASSGQGGGGYGSSSPSSRSPSDPFDTRPAVPPAPPVGTPSTFKDFKGLNPDLSLDPNTSTNLSLRPFLDDAYKNVPGGLDKAVSEAQKHQSAARDSGLVTWNPDAIDTLVPVSNRPEDWSSANRAAGPTLGGTTLIPALKNILTGKRRRLDGTVNLNPSSAYFSTALKKLRALRHELSHAALHDGSLVESPVLSSGDMARVAAPLDALKYTLDPEEFKAHLAEIKREVAKDTGVLIDTPAKARKALEDAGRNPGRDALRTNLPALMKNKTFTDKAILQLLSIVKGDTMKPRGVNA